MSARERRQQIALNSSLRLQRSRVTIATGVRTPTSGASHRTLTSTPLAIAIARERRVKTTRPTPRPECDERPIVEVSVRVPPREPRRRARERRLAARVYVPVTMLRDRGRCHDARVCGRDDDDGDERRRETTSVREDCGRSVGVLGPRRARARARERWNPTGDDDIDQVHE